MLVGLTVAGLAGAVLLPRPAYADGAWLDDQSVTWNTPGMAIPTPVDSMWELDPRCGAQARPAESDEDRAVEAAGWTLFGSYTGGWGVRIVRGLAGYDGMCRPMEYQAFVFVDGKLAGTLSPTPMGSRLDGSLTGLDFFGPDRVVGIYARYTDQDPLCCPSARSTATFKVDRSGAAPVLVRESTTTERTGLAAPTLPPASTSAPMPGTRAPVQLPRA
jgi:hypothetical protein